MIRLLLVLVVLLAGCGASTVDGTASGSGGSCLPPPPSTPVVVPGGPVVARIPDLTLDCFSGGGTVRLTELHRPAIVNLWASWCGPCRTEYAGAGLLHDAKVSFPNLSDPKRRLMSAVGRGALPVTLFVDADGGVRYVYNDVALDDAGLAGLARTHLGVGT